MKKRFETRVDVAYFLNFSFKLPILCIHLTLVFVVRLGYI